MAHLPHQMQLSNCLFREGQQQRPAELWHLSAQPPPLLVAGTVATALSPAARPRAKPVTGQGAAWGTAAAAPRHHTPADMSHCRPRTKCSQQSSAVCRGALRCAAWQAQRPAALHLPEAAERCQRPAMHASAVALQGLLFSFSDRQAPEVSGAPSAVHAERCVLRQRGDRRNFGSKA